MKDHLGEAKSVELKISTIVIGPRRRRTVGNVTSLERSIKAHGLIHPILVRNGHELVTGARRLEACTRLGWTTIPARHIEELPDAEMRALELEENTERVALLDYETSTERLKELGAVAAAARAEELRAPSSHKSRGRPRKPGSRRSVAKGAGVTETTVRKLERHVALADRYPFMKRGPWRQHSVLEAGERLEALPEADRAKAAALLEQAGRPPKKSIEILTNLARMTPTQRKKVLTLVTSDDAHERETALTMAATIPSPPDPGLEPLLGARPEIELAIASLRAIRFAELAKALLAQLDDLIRALKTDSQA